MCMMRAFEAHLRETSAPPPEHTDLSISRDAQGRILVDLTGPRFHDASDHAIAVIEACGPARLDDAEEGAAVSHYAHGLVLRAETGTPIGYRCVFELSPCPARMPPPEAVTAALATVA
ncbi:hypothetical protein [Marinovum sp.]|uniref:hypothetical protein n=1 Tax=Marinovum sp. TaxID=2024839 RepID=UPI002B267D13|nr:hypothetical protein [Marinovum sp.]